MGRTVTWLIGIGLLCFGVRACAPIERVRCGPDFWPGEILLAKDWWLGVLSWLPAVGALLFTVGALLLIRSRRKAAGLSLLLAGIFGFVGSWILFVLGNLAPWRVCDTWQAPDGEVYSFLDSSFLMGQIMVITHGAGTSLLSRRETALVSNNGDSPRSWATVIRPADRSEDRYGRLMYSDSGWLLGMRYNERCYLAYHLLTGQSLGHGDIESISPFLLMNHDTTFDPRDVTNLIDRMKENPHPGPGRPTESAVCAGLEHPNPHVRDLAQELLKIMEEARSSD